MPYSSISEARIKKLNGTPLTLSQINGIAAMADAIGENGWPIAINKFKKTHHAEGGKWVASASEEKELSDLVVSKEDGRWKVVAISTAAFKDQDGHTFTEKCMDYDLHLAEYHDDFPEFRLFHKKGLAFGKVTKMKRVGPFAVDEGYAYDDPFSQHVCEKILSSNDGKWRVSRGFYVKEVSGGCPNCGSGLLLQQKHMIAGFRCPTCKSIFMTKGVLKDLHFLKARTFDVTVTDIPCVPFTGVGAYKEHLVMEEFAMKKEDLRKKLIEAGLEETEVDERLKTVSEKQLKELSDLPDAEVFKELGIEEEDTEEDEEPIDEKEQTFVLDDEVLNSFAEIVKKEVAQQLSEMEIQVADLDGFDIDLKELPQLSELLIAVKDLNGKIDELLKSDKSRVEKMLGDMPRAGKLRIRRFKTLKEEDMEDEDEDMEDEEEGEDEEMPKSMKKQKVTTKQLHDGVLVDGEGAVHGSMTGFVFGDDGGD